MSGPGPTTHETQFSPARPFGRVFLALSDIKLAHSVFALPFAVLGAFLVAPVHAGDGSVAWGRFAGVLSLVVVCMVLARTWAMLVNRVADREIDAGNPRTTGRAFARGALSGRDGAVMLAVSGGSFLAAAGLFGVVYGNWWPAVLAGPVLGWIALYSYTKRFTWLCHVFLGGALAVSPLCAAIAVDPSVFSLGWRGWGSGGVSFAPTGMGLMLLAGMVLCWVAGFDVIYALQDLEHDQRVGLNSVPARFGWRSAIWISRVLHAAAVGCLVLAWRVEPRFGALFLVAVVVVGGVLLAEHAVLARRGRAGIPMAFFTLNGVVSVVLGVVGALDVL